MAQLDSAYLGELGSRIAFVSALPGRFAAAFFAALLAAPERGKLSNWAPGLAGFAAVSLLCACLRRYVHSHRRSSRCPGRILRRRFGNGSASHFIAGPAFRHLRADGRHCLRRLAALAYGRVDDDACGVAGRGAADVGLRGLLGRSAFFSHALGVPERQRD